MYESKNLDHLGLVSGMCDELSLVSEIDRLLPSSSDERKISTGLCVKSLIMNGLGFIGRRLYLVSDFFSDKPVSHLLGEGITAEMLNDDRLGRCLDDLYSFGLSELYSHLAAKSYEILGLDQEPRFYHADSTSFHVDGSYNSDSYQAGDACIHLTQGYSRDHRPDLNQACLNLIVENSAGLPLFMEGLSGNSCDKHSIVKSIARFTSSLSVVPPPLFWVADSALYSADNLSTLRNIGFWLTRVPETIAEVGLWKACVSVEDMHTFPEKELSDYRYALMGSYYGHIKQMWMLVFSQHAYDRELKTLQKTFLKHSLVESKAVESLCKQVFACQTDANNALAMLQTKCQYIHFTHTAIQPIETYSQRGKPKKDAQKVLKGYQIVIEYACKISLYEEKKKTLGFFVLATNNITQDLTPSQTLSGYKGQIKVEKGFRFMKDPDFHAATMFVKKPERVESVMMLMALSLLVYAALEFTMRKALKQQNITLPDQKKKEIQNPTMKWIFTLFRGIHWLNTPQQEDPILLNINQTHKKVILLFSRNVRKYYKCE